MPRSLFYASPTSTRVRRIARTRAYGPPTALSTNKSAAPLRGEAGCLPESPTGRREAATRLGTGFPKTSTAGGGARNGGQLHGLPLTARTTTGLLMKRAQEKAGKNSIEFGKGGAVLGWAPRRVMGIRMEAGIRCRKRPLNAPAKVGIEGTTPARIGEESES